MEEEIKVEIEEINNYKNNYRPNYRIDQEADGIFTGQVIGVTITRLTIDQVILDQITDKIPSGCLETEVKVDIQPEITIMNIQEVEVEIDMITGPFSQDKAHYLMEEMNLGLDLTLGWVLIMIMWDAIGCREYDHFASECPNIPTNEEPDYDNADPASLQMMTQDYYPIDSEREVEYLNL